MTQEEEEIKKKFNLNLENAVFELTKAMETRIYENAGSCIREALKDIKKAAEVYDEDSDIIDELELKEEFRLPY